MPAWSRYEISTPDLPLSSDLTPTPKKGRGLVHDFDIEYPNPDDYDLIQFQESIYLFRNSIGWNTFILNFFRILSLPINP